MKTTELLRRPQPWNRGAPRRWHTSHQPGTPLMKTTQIAVNLPLGHHPNLASLQETVFPFTVPPYTRPTRLEGGVRLS
jgi:hypothetical protein